MPTDMHQLPREEFIERNLGLVHACAGRFKGRGIEYEELYAAGCLGLVKACDGFDTGRGVCFSTYAVPVILGEIKKLFRDGGTVKVSRSLKELSLKINAERERCLKRTGQEPGVTELAETLGTTPEQIAEKGGRPCSHTAHRADRPRRHGLAALSDPYAGADRRSALRHNVGRCDGRSGKHARLRQRRKTSEGNGHGAFREMRHAQSPCHGGSAHGKPGCFNALFQF